MYRRVSIIALAIGMSPSLFGQTPAAQPVNLPPAPLLPQTFGVFKQVSVSDALPAEIASKGNSEETNRELELKRQAYGTYERTDGGKTTLHVLAEDMQDATGAYSAFTLARSGLPNCAEAAKIGHDCALGNGEVLFWQGETFVRITAEGTSPIRLPELQPLVDALPKPHGPKSVLPVLPNRLPREGLVLDSIRYGVGPETFAAALRGLPEEIATNADYSKSPEIVVARYRGKKSGTGMLAILFYPTNQIAAERMRFLEKTLKSHDDMAVRRVATTVAIAGGGFTKEQAKALVERVTSHEDFSFNNASGYQPKHQETLQESASVLVQVMVFVVVMTLAALVLGVFFGGARALLRKAQGKPLSSLDDLEFIKLEIGGKPSAKLQIPPHS